MRADVTKLLVVVLSVMATVSVGAGAGKWRGLTVAPESRCSPFDRGDYSHAPTGGRKALEDGIVADMGGSAYGPYEGRHFESARDAEIGPIVAFAEAHDSGLCAAGPAVRSRFAADIKNLTLASRELNRHEKASKDAAEWMPPLNRCWFAARSVDIRRKYGLTIDQAEAEALESVLNDCQHYRAVIEAPSPLRLYDDDGDGKISCLEARGHKIAPVARDHPAYAHIAGGDGGRAVCE